MRLDLSKKLKQIRAVKGITHETLADLVGVKKGTIGNVETGKCVPSLALLEKICDVCGYKLLIVPKGAKVAVGR